MVGEAARGSTRGYSVTVRRCACTALPSAHVRLHQATTGAALSDAVMVATVVGTRGASAHINS